jgi:hypothetical protein
VNYDDDCYSDDLFEEIRDGVTDFVDGCAPRLRLLEREELIESTTESFEEDEHFTIEVEYFGNGDGEQSLVLTRAGEELVRRAIFRQVFAARPCMPAPLRVRVRACRAAPRRSRAARRRVAAATRGDPDRPRPSSAREGAPASRGLSGVAFKPRACRPATSFERGALA